MRIISGKYRGLQVPMPAGGHIRPTTDRAREAIFNILFHRFNLPELSVLDLYTGSAAMAIEFASRGVPAVHCVDRNAKTIASLRSFLQKKHIDELTLESSDAIQYLKSNKAEYDLIFADPPYSDPEVKELPATVINSTTLKKGGLFILEHELNRVTDHPSLWDRRVYGQSVFSFYLK